ncbi:hypothetical protein OCU04_009149 [Sclerotinia nivalis]|uniref:Uncharacterized protein n=1 Tax=Sclerotinia nivalis TaxID=352851 RepID=A0A9X0DGG3_9HELO|nr:hypothetical protein OCU04_009149 [Sclerotinia nivalis]
MAIWDILEKIAFLLDSKQLVVLLSFEDAIKISCSRLCHIQTHPQPYDETKVVSDYVKAIAFSSDGRTLVSRYYLYWSYFYQSLSHPETEHFIWTLQQTYSIDGNYDNLVLSQDHQCFETDKGSL